MKKILIVNNNMKVGGVQKSLYNLLWSVKDQCDITLYLFSQTGEYADKLPKSVRMEACTSLFRYLGVSQEDCEGSLRDRLIRGSLAALCKLFGRSFVIRLMELSQRKLPETYDVAISYLQNGNPKSFYGGVNEFVLRKVTAQQKIAYFHCDYCNCGANDTVNNRLYFSFDKIAACSEGCRKSFQQAIPELREKCITAPNFHRYPLIQTMAKQKPVEYEAGRIHLLTVGRLAHEKAIDRAIRAAAYGMEQGLPVSLHIVGGGNKMAELKMLAVDLHIQDHVFFYGEQSNPYRFMLHADLLLVTSYHEAAPMVIEEARAVGLPVLTVKTTSSKEMVTETACGWVCENIQQSLNEYLSQLLSNYSSIEKRKKALRAVVPDNQKAIQAYYFMIEDRNEN